MDNDLIREKILESLYAAHQSGRSRDSQMLGIRDVAHATKQRVAGIKENQVAANVSFLVQNELVDEVAVENYFAKKQFGGGKPSYKYRLSRTGLAYFEHGSKYDRSNVFAGIGDISGSGNFIVIGSNNSVTNIANVSYADGHKLTKVSIQGDLETIKSQLSKTTPRRWYPHQGER